MTPNVRSEDASSKLVTLLPPQCTEEASKTMSNTKKSPCLGVCTIDPITKLCIGCGRTLQEISIHGD